MSNELRMPNGKHAGELITRVPLSYLKWMVNVNHSWAQQAQVELDRRGTKTPTLEVSHHAIDRASLRCRKIWHETKMDDEGIYSWLMRMSQEALQVGERKENTNRFIYQRMKFVFELTGIWPVLLTIMPKKGKQQ